MELSPYYQKSVECLFCKRSFPTTKIRSRFIKVIGHGDDFQPLYEENGVNPLLYNVRVCEHCGFSFTDEFTRYFAPGVREDVQETITSHWVPRSYGGERSLADGLVCYKLALLCAQIKREKHVARAGLALRIAWLLRGQNDPAEQRFLQMALESYGASYSEEDFKGTQMSEERILYLMAVLARKTGDEATARRHLSKVIEHQSRAIDGQVIELAKQLWQSMRKDA